LIFRKKLQLTEQTFQNDYSAFSPSRQVEPGFRHKNQEQCWAEWGPPLTSGLLCLRVRDPRRSQQTNRSGLKGEEVLGHGPRAHQASTDEPFYHVSSTFSPLNISCTNLKLILIQ
jgi:hypothetical protein